MTPAYPKLVPSFIEGVQQTKLEVFNRRADVEYYEIGVFDANWAPVPFVTSYRLVHVEYLKRVQIDVYVNSRDARRAAYVCSKSKLRTESPRGTVITSKICSKFLK